MELIKSKNYNENYLTKIVQIDSFHAHPDPEVTKLKCAYVDGYNIIVGIDSNPGKYLYFPTSSQINPQFISFANLYRHSEKNADTTQTGMFEDNGRVKAIKLRGCISEGFLLPIEFLIDWIADSVSLELTDEQLQVGLEFDTFKHKDKSFWISKKYIIRKNYSHSSGRTRGFNNRKGVSKVIENQFRRHYDTVLLKKEPHVIKPDDYVHISSKWDGTSAISAYVLCHKKLNIFQKLVKWLTGISFDEYDYLFSSRNVIQNEYLGDTGYYGKGDYTSRLSVHKVLEPHLIKGMTIYYEIVGYTNEGKPWIRRCGKDMDYGCVPSDTNYVEGVNYKIYIYRITLTNVDGMVHEFSPLEVQQWCKEHDLMSCIQFYYGKAKNLYPDINDSEQWSLDFMDKLANDKNFYMELDSPDCVNKVPHEGIVIKKDDGVSRAWKLKTFKHVKGEQDDLDKGVENTEDDA